VRNPTQQKLSSKLFPSVIFQFQISYLEGLRGYKASVKRNRNRNLKCENEIKLGPIETVIIRIVEYIL